MSDELPPDGRVLDEALLRHVAQKLGELTLVDAVSVFPAEKRESVVVQFDTRQYPAWMSSVTLELRAYLGGAFHITYRETWNGEAWMCRWDRHENPHSSRDHFHEPPDARTADAVDRDYPEDFMAVVELVLTAVEDRLGEVWDTDALDS